MPGGGPQALLWALVVLLVAGCVDPSGSNALQVSRLGARSLDNFVPAFHPL